MISLSLLFFFIGFVLYLLKTDFSKLGGLPLKSSRYVILDNDVFNYFLVYMELWMVLSLLV